MRTLAVLAVVIAASSLNARDANAQGRYWPWCSRYGWSTVCGFATFQQCLESVSGAGGFCQPNMMPPPVPVRATAKRKHRSRY